MARYASETLAELEMFLDCPECEFSEVVYYTKKPPEYCSDRCKQRAYRKRRAGTQTLVYVDGLDDIEFSQEMERKIRKFAENHGVGAGKDLVDILKYSTLELSREMRKRNKGYVTL